MEKNIEYINEEEFRSILKQDGITCIIQAHLSLELFLNAIIDELLVDEHKLEIARLSFALKIDLCFALGAFDADTKRLIVKLNQIRNAFAHRPKAKFDENDAVDLLNLIPVQYRNVKRNDEKMPFDDLKFGFVISYFALNISLKNTVYKKLHKQAWLEEVDAFLKPLPPNERKDYLKESLDTRLLNRIKSKLKNYSIDVLENKDNAIDNKNEEGQYAEV